MATIRHIDFQVPNWGEFATGPQPWTPPSFSDDFDRANEALETSSNWTQRQGSASVSSNEVSGSTDALFVFEADVADDQYAQLEAVASANRAYAAVRIPASGTGGYGCQSAGTYVRIHRIETDGTRTMLAQSNTGTGVSAGDLYRLEAEGNTIRLKRNGVEVASTTDSTFTQGRVGLAGTGKTLAGDAWEGGNL